MHYSINFDTLYTNTLLCTYVAPQPFQSEVKIDVTFLRDGTPITEVSFEVC